MADIVINEISQNYSYVIGDNSYCCVALPITSCWGPAYTGPIDEDDTDSTEDIVWQRFRANSQGLESFVSTYRGAAANYRLSEDYSYQMAVSLLTAGYDVLVCRLSPGSKASGFLRRTYTGALNVGWLTPTVIADGNVELPIIDGESIPLYCNATHQIAVSASHPNFSSKTIAQTVAAAPASTDPTGIYIVGDGNTGNITSVIFHLNATAEEKAIPATWAAFGIANDTEYIVTGDTDLVAQNQGTLGLTAKYPGTFGNRLQCSLRRMTTAGVKYWSLVTYIVDASGVRIAVENLNFVFDVENSTDAIPYVEEVQSQFIDIFADRLNEESIFAELVDDKLTIVFTSGSDKGNFTDVQTSLRAAVDLAATRYNTAVIETPYQETGVDNFADVNPDDEVTLQHIPVKSVSKVEFRQNSEDTWREAPEGDFYEVDDPAAGTIVLHGAPFGSSSYQVQITYVYDSQTRITLSSAVPYVSVLCSKYNHYENVDDTTAQTYEYLEWVFTNCLPLYTLLEDKLAYNPNRVISPGWDDQNFLRLTGESSYPYNITTPSPIHLKLMETAYKARCATAYIDIPKSLAKKYVSNDSQDSIIRGYAQLLARQEYADTDGLFTTHSALFGPWGNYTYVGTNKQSTASPSFLALLIQRAMILNQSLQYEWLQPTSRKNNVKIGKMDYTVSKKYLEIWQPDPDTEGGVGVNAIANIPDLGLSIWGDSTLYENPPATYQALRNLSTRLLVNAIKNVVYRVGISITFQYTNQTAFSSFYVGVTPILDSMKNAGAIGDYKVVIGNDFDAIGMVKANSCVGKIYLTPSGTIQKITVDLIALPPQTDLTNYT